MIAAARSLLASTWREPPRPVLWQLNANSAAYLEAMSSSPSSPEESPVPEIDPAPSPIEVPESPPVHAPVSPTPTTPTTTPPVPPMTDPPISPINDGNTAMQATWGWSALVVLALTASPFYATAQAPASASAAASRTTPGAPPVNAADRHFMDEAASGGMLEIVLGRVAQEKSTSEAVKQFGAHMVDDHNKANEELKALAAAKGAPLPTGLSAEQKAMVSHMKKIKGPAFDRQYMAQMLADHRKTVALFDRATVSASDADVKAFAARMLPTLRSHLDMAQQTSAEVNGAAGKVAKRK